MTVFGELKLLIVVTLNEDATNQICNALFWSYMSFFCSLFSLESIKPNNHGTINYEYTLTDVLAN